MVGCMTHNLYCIPAYYLINLILLPLYYISIDHYARVEIILYNWLLYIVSSWSWCGGLVVHEHGDDIYSLRNDPNVRILLLANHQSTADVPLMMQSFTSKTEFILLWVMDAVFKWTNFGIVSQTHGDYFLNTKQYKSGALLKHCSLDYARLKNLFILFPEGGFRYKRQKSSNSFAIKKNLPMLTNVTYPRFGAYNELMDPLLHVTHVVDLTICYDDVEHPPSIVDIIGGRRVTEIHFYYRIHAIKDNPEIRTEAWLRELWQAKDRFLAAYYSEQQLKKQRRRASSRTSTSLSGSFNSKSSYSSMSKRDPIQFTPNEQIPMLNEEVNVTNGLSTKKDSAAINGNENSVSNNVTIKSNVDLIQLDNDISSSEKEVVINANNGANFQPTTNAEISESNNTSFVPEAESTIAFIRDKGHAIELSWFKIFLIHCFYLLICLITYEVIAFAFQ